MRKIGWRVAPLVGVVMMGLSAPLAARAEVVIAALGDSLTQGYGLPEEQGFVPQMEDWLQAQGADVRMINAGVSGDTTAGGLSRVEWSLTPEIEGMIVALGGNDLLRGLPPETSRGNLEGILEVAEAQEIEVLLVGMTAPGNYGPDYKAGFDAIYPELAAQYDTLYFPDFFRGILPEGGTPQDAAGMMQGDGIHPNADGVALIVESMGPSVEELISRIQSGD